ncbi:hypothetical protein ADL06_07250 [Streptomyces sp. NRRL F-6491]|nr:hypothetical protein ADL06_07250 [Streptomyces sp. NRRL F-6491]KOX50269.1 hypothetical protein ADL08_06865 [Streptomyces sp. NRRL F-6492]
MLGAFGTRSSGLGDRSDGRAGAAALADAVEAAVRSSWRRSIQVCLNAPAPPSSAPGSDSSPCPAPACSSISSSNKAATTAISGDRHIASAWGTPDGLAI